MDLPETVQLSTTHILLNRLAFISSKNYCFYSISSLSFKINELFIIQDDTKMSTKTYVW